MTFYIDFKEIFEGRELVEKLKEATEKVKRDFDSLISFLNDNQGKIQEFLITFDRWTRGIEGLRKDNDVVRQKLADERHAELSVEGTPRRLEPDRSWI